jgi:hypothetical protein
MTPDALRELARAAANRANCDCGCRSDEADAIADAVVAAIEGAIRASALEALEEAIDLADEGWAYADDCYRDKWDFEPRIAKLRALARGAKPEGGAKPNKETP